MSCTIFCQPARWKNVASGHAMTNASHRLAVAMSAGMRRLMFNMGCSSDAHRLTESVQKNLIHTTPLEVPQQLIQTSFHPVNIEVMTKARLAADAFNARLSGVNLPGMKIKDT